MKKSLIAFIAKSNKLSADLTTQFSHANQHLRLTNALIQTSDFAHILSYLANNPSPKLLVIDVSDVQAATDAPLQHALQQLAEVCEPGTKVILIGQQIPLDEYRQLLEVGIEEYLALPMPYELLLNAMQQALGFSAIKRHKKSKHVVISGLQGGVGSTTLTAALSLKLAQQGNHTLIADIDTELGDLALFWPNITQQAISTQQLHDISQIDRASQQLSQRLNYLPIKTSANEDVAHLQDTLSNQASTILWDIPRHHQLANEFWQQADVCIWVLESSVSVLKHWHSIKTMLEKNTSEHTHQRHIFVLNKTRKERAQQISTPALEQAFQQSFVVLPYAGQQALDAANLGKVENLLSGMLGQGIDDVCAHLQIRSKTKPYPSSPLQKLLLPFKKLKPKKTTV